MRPSSRRKRVFKRIFLYLAMTSRDKPSGCFSAAEIKGAIGAVDSEITGYFFPKTY